MGFADAAYFFLLLIAKSRDPRSRSRALPQSKHDKEHDSAPLLTLVPPIFTSAHRLGG